MGCACEAVHGLPCQFPDETVFHAFDGQQWCLFHLPLEDAEGNKSPKDGWKAGEPDWQRFEDKVFERLRNPRDENPNPFIPHRVSDLRAVVFPHYFDFTTVEDTTLYPDFTRAVFGDGTAFAKVIFGGDARFAGAAFGDGAWFRGATFGNGAWFEDATFGNGAWFEDATFGVHARFAGATFGNVAGFADATFGGTANFADAVFIGTAFFQASAKAPENRRFSQVSFSGVEFRGSCSFENREFSAAASFAHATFHDLVAFHGCTFHQDMSFHQTKFKKTKGKDDSGTEALERAYRTLKLAMENLRARNEEARFFALEMECHRQRGDVPRFERLAAWGYELVSEYGRSIGRPPIWMAVALLWAAIFYGLVAIGSGAMFVCEPKVLAVEITETVFGQLIKPFRIWEIGQGPEGAGFCLYPHAPWLVPTIASVQTIVVIALIAVFLLALRRRFKMD